MSGRTPPDALRDKIVFVGTNALGTREVVATPLDTLFAGVEVQATVADNLLQQDFISRSALARASAKSRRSSSSASRWRSCSRPRAIVAGLLAARSAPRRCGWAASWLLASAGVFVSPLFGIVGVAAELSVMTLANFTVRAQAGASVPAGSGRRRASCWSRACCR